MMSVGKILDRLLESLGDFWTLNQGQWESNCSLKTTYLHRESFKSQKVLITICRYGYICISYDDVKTGKNVCGAYRGENIDEVIQKLKFLKERAHND